MQNAIAGIHTPPNNEHERFAWGCRCTSTRVRHRRWYSSRFLREQGWVHVSSALCGVSQRGRAAECPVAPPPATLLEGKAKNGTVQRPPHRDMAQVVRLFLCTSFLENPNGVIRRARVGQTCPCVLYFSALAIRAIVL